MKTAFKNILLIVLLFIIFCACTVKEDRNSSNDKNDKIRLRIDSSFLILENPKIISAIREYIESNKSDPPRVYTLAIQREDFLTTTINLCSIITYDEFNKSIPTGYFIIDGKVVLVYTGFEKLQEATPEFLAELKGVIGGNLEDNLLPDGTLDPDYKGRIFDPWAWEIKLVKDSVVINKDSARNVLGPPIVEIIKFVPPKTP